MGRRIKKEFLIKYQEYLYEAEMAQSTIKKYIRDINKLIKYASGREITKKLLVTYKKDLRVKNGFKLGSINTFLVAVNRFFEYMEWFDLKIETYHIQKDTFVPENRNMSEKEYKKLVNAANKKGKKRLAMIIQTISGTGMRVSELKYLTAESVKDGVVVVFNKNKQRKILLPEKLKEMLLEYMEEKDIKTGIIFRTSRGNAVDRSNIWREMKALGKDADIAEKKIYPHNFRNLFAKTFYNVSKDIAKLAGILGHSSIETTRGYIMETSREYQKQLDLMGLL